MILMPKLIIIVIAITLGSFYIHHKYKDDDDDGFDDFEDFDDDIYL